MGLIKVNSSAHFAWLNLIKCTIKAQQVKHIANTDLWVCLLSKRFRLLW